MKAAFFTLGCKVNQYETEALKEIFRREGYTVIPFSQKADVYVVNTCTVTRISDSKSRQAIRRAVRQNPHGVVAVVGCYSQVSPSQVEEIPGVDIILGTERRAELPRLVEKARRGQRINLVRDLGEGVFENLPWPQNSDKARAFLKIQEGCREFCTYCIVPHARGPLRSQELQQVLENVAAVRARGYREMVLTGTHLGAWGRDLVPPSQLSHLLRAIPPMDAPERIRLSSLEPADVDEGLINALADLPFLCRHLHIPLQSGSDPILRAMGRPYRQESFRRLVRELKNLDPGMAISTDVMVGFPGEEEEHFRETLAFVKEMAFSRLHVFTYSPRQGTRAAVLPHRVSSPIVKERARLLRDAGHELAARFAEGFAGKRVRVLLEKSLGGGCLEGLTEQYLRIRLKAPPTLLAELVQARVTDVEGNLLFGELEEN